MRVSLSPPAAEHGRCHVRGPARGGAVDGAMPLQKALGKKAEDWKNKGLEQESFIVAINACHSDYSWGAESRAIYGRHDAEADACAEFPKPLDRVAGVIVFGECDTGKGVLGPSEALRESRQAGSGMPAVPSAGTTPERATWDGLKTTEYVSLGKLGRETPQHLNGAGCPERQSPISRHCS